MSALEFKLEMMNYKGAEENKVPIIDRESTPINSLIETRREDGVNSAVAAPRQSFLPEVTKKLALLLLTMVALGHSACKKSDNDQGELPPPPRIVDSIPPWGDLPPSRKNAGDDYRELADRLERNAEENRGEKGGVKNWDGSVPENPALPEMNSDHGGRAAKTNELPACLEAKKEASILLSALRIYGKDLLEEIAILNRAGKEKHCVDAETKERLLKLIQTILTVTGGKEMDKTLAAIRSACANPTLAEAVTDIFRKATEERDDLIASGREMNATVPTCPSSR